MKKVAIMTWYSYNNYGSVLQSFALCSTIKKIGYEPSLINYNPNERVRINYSFSSNLGKNIKRIHSFFNNKILYPKTVSDYSKYDEFRNKYLNITSPCYTSTDLYNLNSIYDCFVCGSDQIWAPTVFDSKYFLDFVDSTHKIAYAPSIGLPRIDNSTIKKEMSKLISDFRYLSTREENGKKIIKEICGKDAQVVLDPTLLIDKNEWVKKFNLIHNNEEYILCYFLTENSNSYKVAKKISKQLNIPLKLIPINNKDFYRKEAIKEPLGPSNFVDLIYNASLVLTDSFHGTIFSMNFNVPFLTFKRFKDNGLSQNSRIYSILKMTNLEERIYSKKYNLKNILTIDYKNANKVLNDKRKESLLFLKNSLKSAIETDNCKDKITNICSGCGMCAVVCPKKCITIEKNKYGFYEKRIDKNNCIKCNMCEKVCCQNCTSSKSIDKCKIYSAISNDNSILMNSSSGGLAHEICLHALNNNSFIIGCEYDLKDNIAKHIVIKDIEELKKLDGSKYLQSYTVDAFKQIKKLNNGVIIGTPCQIASVSMYLNRINKRSDFILIDIICHGVPSYNLWNKYLKEKKFDNINNICFRNKKYGWRSKCLFISGKKDYYGKDNNDNFLKFFTIGNSYNHSCYECNFRTKSCADIRLGDFWGPKFKNNKSGVSMVLSFSDTGDRILNELKKDGRIKIHNEDIKDYYSNQQVKNFYEPLYYYNLINDISNDEKNLSEIGKKYVDFFVKKNNRHKKIFKIISYFKKRG